MSIKSIIAYVLSPPDLEESLQNVHLLWSLESLELTFYNYLGGF